MALSTVVEASEIVAGHLYQGSVPPIGNHLKDAGFTHVVLCAEEWQPPNYVRPDILAPMGYVANTDPYPGVTILHSPNDDDYDIPPSRIQLALAIKTAKAVADAVLSGGKVLVTCWAGRNRSGLVSALALHKITGASGEACISFVQKARSRALTNPQFVEALGRIR
jgi:hypothetical protein